MIQKKVTLQPAYKSHPLHDSAVSKMEQGSAATSVYNALKAGRTPNPEFVKFAQLKAKK